MKQYQLAVAILTGRWLIPCARMGVRRARKTAATFALAFLAAMTFQPANSSAILLTSDPATGITTTFTDSGSATYGGVILDGFFISGTPSVFLSNSGYGLNLNGEWGIPNFSYIATNDPAGSMTVDLGGNYGLVGGFMNYAEVPGGGGFADPTITALDASENVLATFDLATQAPISTGSSSENSGAFRGIQINTDTIHFLEFSGSFIIDHTIEVGDPALPEPATLALVGLGLVGIGFSRRNRLL